MNAEEREESIDRIANKVIDNIYAAEGGGELWIRELLIYGDNIRGYANMSDEELKELHKEIFDSE